MGMFGVVAHDVFLEALRQRVPKDVSVGVSHLGGDGIQITLRHVPGGTKKQSFLGMVSLSWVSGTVAASTELFIAEKHRRKGYSGVLETLKVAACKIAGITMIVATVKHDNVAEIGAIQKHGWQRMAVLDHEDLWGKILNDTPTYLSFLERRK
jgi:RimJ/RimL family protein N-acetyltransferase